MRALIYIYQRYISQGNYLTQYRVCHHEAADEDVNEFETE